MFLFSRHRWFPALLIVFGSWICSTILSSMTVSSPRLETLLPGFARSSTSCNDHLCLDPPNGLRIFDAHIRHLTGVWDLIEGLGHPGMETFTPTRQRLMHDSYPLGVYRDTASQVFMRRMSNFISDADQLDFILTRELLAKAVHSFRDISTMTSTRTAFIGLSGADSDRVDTDRILNTTFAVFVQDISRVCNSTLDNVGKVLPTSTNTSSTGNDLASEWGHELKRIQDALNSLPWWDVWTLAHWAGNSDTARYREYSKFLADEEQTFRLLADAALAIHDNLVDLRDYCLWYSDRETVRLMHEHTRNKKHPPLETVSRHIDQLVNRVEITRMVRVKPDVPGWPPRRVRSRDTPWL
ncbi:hypothetical protein C8R43DRAFT_1015606 [Mycena crocata]|nr:hypothetical protein C8R43DRAFT_1015606 [Mycena crocata]